jgi:hypothetical protein
MYSNSEFLLRFSTDALDAKRIAWNRELRVFESRDYMSCRFLRVQIRIRDHQNALKHLILKNFLGSHCKEIVRDAINALSPGTLGAGNTDPAIVNTMVLEQSVHKTGVPHSFADDKIAKG